MKQGKLIVIDGTDGSGKGTQTKLLVERLAREGHNVHLLDFPRYGNPSAFFVEKYLRGEYGELKDMDAKKTSFFYALDRYDASFEARRWLDEGAILIANRYASSNKGIQMAKIADPNERRRFLAWLNELEYDILHIPRPDLTILLHVPGDIGYDLVAKKDARDYLQGKTRDIHESNRAYLKDTVTAYLSLPDLDTHEHWTILECMEHEQLLPIPVIHERLWQLIQTVL